VKSGDKTLAHELEAEGYAGVVSEGGVRIWR
jgi:Fe-S cluster assembly ATPase SufC